MSKKMFVAALMISASIPAIARCEENSKEVVIISAARPNLPSENLAKAQEIKNDSVIDAASILNNTAGAAIIHNGIQTGIVQLNGLSQDRVKIRIDGMEITPGCPNHMDPPMHYVNAQNIDKIAIAAGITSVVSGGDSIGGTVTINTIAPQFSENDKMDLSGRIDARYLGATDGYDVSLSTNIGFEKIAFRVNANANKGDDLKYSGGVAALTRYKSSKIGLDSEFQIGDTQWGFGIANQWSRDIGTPALGMDMAVDDAQSIKLGFFRDLEIGRLSGRVFSHQIDHIMDNYSLRTATPSNMKMRAPAESDDLGFAFGLEMDVGTANLKIGTDGHFNKFDVYQENLASGMKRDMFSAGTRDRTGVYAEYDNRIGEKLRLVLGARFETLETDMGPIQYVMMMNENAAKDAFNSANKFRRDYNFDFTMATAYSLSQNLKFELGLAQKTRSPSLVERYLWSPSSTYGLADGRNYLGNLDLKPEISRQIALSSKIRFGALQFEPSVYFNKIDDYIQGVAVSTAADAVLKFQNIKAEIYGLNADFDYQLGEKANIYGNLSYARGKNKTYGDNLYRIAPLRGTVGIEFSVFGFKNLFEIKASTKQDKTAKYNNELKTDGWAIANFKSRYEFNENFGLNFGIENLFDEYYAEHLSGINRVNNAPYGGDLAVGARIPAPGRYVYFGIGWGF